MELWWGTDSSHKSMTSLALDTRTQIARVHALLIYQVIGLFDGDIRARHQAEKRAVIMNLWTNELLGTASQNLSQLFCSESFDAFSSNFARSVTHAEKRWNAWSLAESVRRIWLVAMGVYAVYFALQEGWALCAGGIMFTNRQGIWNAKSATEWERLCTPDNIEFIQRFDAEKFFTTTKPQHIDKFSKAMLEVTFGTERLEKWMECHNYVPNCPV